MRSLQLWKGVVVNYMVSYRQANICLTQGPNIGEGPQAFAILLQRQQKPGLEDSGGPFPSSSNFVFVDI